VVSTYSLVGIVMNAISRSKPERFVMVPVATVLIEVPTADVVLGDCEQAPKCDPFKIGTTC